MSGCLVCGSRAAAILIGQGNLVDIGPRHWGQALCDDCATAFYREHAAGERDGSVILDRLQTGAEGGAGK